MKAILGKLVGAITTGTGLVVALVVGYFEISKARLEYDEAQSKANHPAPSQISNTQTLPNDSKGHQDKSKPSVETTQLSTKNPPAQSSAKVKGHEPTTSAVKAPDFTGSYTVRGTIPIQVAERDRVVPLSGTMNVTRRVAGLGSFGTFEHRWNALDGVRTVKGTFEALMEGGQLEIRYQSAGPANLGKMRSTLRWDNQEKTWVGDWSAANTRDRGELRLTAAKTALIKKK